MSLDLYVIKGGKNLRCGYTTGSCATGAAKAAAIMLETKKKIDYVEIETPADIDLKLELYNQTIVDDYVIASIVKDAGDDPDNTDGISIFARVSKRTDGKIVIDGGEGIGRIVRKGLFGEVGEAAINPVPREMITKELREVSDSGYDVLIYAPLGEAIGKKTFNSNIGIVGGISIIGTKGIVYPMSDDALLKTIYMEVDMIEQKNGLDHIVLTPGNYGEKISDSLDMGDSKVKVSNYLGDSLLYIYNRGFKSVTLVGHIGKFAKLSVGVFNTHSKVCDGRIEAFIYYLSLMGAPMTLIEKVNQAITAEEALDICIKEGHGEVLREMEKGSEDRIKRYLKDEEYPVKVIIYSMEWGLKIC
jgi:cobalt-precorrin-5B (C1)-methyltransferase